MLHVSLKAVYEVIFRVRDIIPQCIDIEWNTAYNYVWLKQYILQKKNKFGYQTICFKVKTNSWNFIRISVCILDLCLCIYTIVLLELSLYFDIFIIILHCSLKARKRTHHSKFCTKFRFVRIQKKFKSRPHEMSFVLEPKAKQFHKL